MHFEQYSFDNSSLARKQEKVAFSPDLFISHTSLSACIVLSYVTTRRIYRCLFTCALREERNQLETDMNLSPV